MPDIFIFNSIDALGSVCPTDKLFGITNLVPVIYVFISLNCDTIWGLIIDLKSIETLSPLQFNS